MKTTIEISTPLLNRARKFAEKENTTLRSLVETGLFRVLSEKEKPPVNSLPPQITFKGNGLTPEFADASWEKIRDAIYETTPL